MSPSSKVSTPADLNRLKYYRIHVQMGTVIQEAIANRVKQNSATGAKLEKLKSESRDLVNRHKELGLEAALMQRTILKDIAKGDF